VYVYTRVCVCVCVCNMCVYQALNVYINTLTA